MATMNEINVPENAKNAASSLFANSKSRATGSDLGKDAFLQLLVAQMRYQDPLDTTSNTEFVSQLAQFSALEQMQQMNAGFAEMKAQNMIGKVVVGYTTYQDPETKEWITKEIMGVVDGTFTANGKTYLVVGGYYMDPDTVSVVIDSGKDYDQGILNSANLIGKYVSATITEKDGSTRHITGKVDTVVFKDGRYYAIINDEEVDISLIEQISEKPIETRPDEIVGTYVTATVKDADGNDMQIVGKISGLVYKNGKYYAVVNGHEIDPAETKGILEAGNEWEGKWISATVKDEDGNPQKIVGKITRVDEEDGKFYFYIGDQKINVDDVNFYSNSEIPIDSEG